MVEKKSTINYDYYNEDDSFSCWGALAMWRVSRWWIGERTFDPKARCTAYNSACSLGINCNRAASCASSKKKKIPYSLEDLKWSRGEISRKYETVVAENLASSLEYQTWHFKYWIAYWTFHGDRRNAGKAKGGHRFSAGNKMEIKWCLSLGVTSCSGMAKRQSKIEWESSYGNHWHKMHWRVKANGSTVSMKPLATGLETKTMCEFWNLLKAMNSPC
ncbi:hypothetical protein HELRODRAFT_178146 [Helobdella robusta]|uniref:Uncharacterized protein n=1 Tax=Helobdella robusta TaxID=6412 RepID=T1FCU2_HELRO|nr:hypothetical protein HELRODRAFT_178146 [Helobdella robusta]ESN97359.1 hypothetical protein HELRODRAFT_178146 [Helobdella robusta]